MKPDKESAMYERGRRDAIYFAYVPDFKNEQEKIDWITGFTDQKIKMNGR